MGLFDIFRKKNKQPTAEDISKLTKEELRERLKEIESSKKPKRKERPMCYYSMGDFEK
ncbi:MAG: hypothetical protein LBR26_03430 [Prevotella sp.]|jgi:hypothetical protein|nr:hypothetical protein [Prevotella sp.]